MIWHLYVASIWNFRQVFFEGILAKSGRFVGGAQGAEGGIGGNWQKTVNIGDGEKYYQAGIGVDEELA